MAFPFECPYLRLDKYYQGQDRTDLLCGKGQSVLHPKNGARAIHSLDALEHRIQDPLNTSSSHLFSQYHLARPSLEAVGSARSLDTTSVKLRPITSLQLIIKRSEHALGKLLKLPVDQAAAGIIINSLHNQAELTLPHPRAMMYKPTSRYNRQTLPCHIRHQRVVQTLYKKPLKTGIYLVPPHTTG